MFQMHKDLGHVSDSSPPKELCYSELVASIWSPVEYS